jgi:hypothetical protein
VFSHSVSTSVPTASAVAVSVSVPQKPWSGPPSRTWRASAPGPPKRVESVPPVQEVVAPGAHECVRAGVAAQGVGEAGAAQILDIRERVERAAAGVLGAGDREIHGDGAGGAELVERVVQAGTPDHGVVVGAGQEVVVSIEAGELVVAGSAHEDVSALAADELVAAGAARERVTARNAIENDADGQRIAGARPALRPDDVRPGAANGFEAGYVRGDDVRIRLDLAGGSVGIDPVGPEANAPARRVGPHAERGERLVVEVHEDLDQGRTRWVRTAETPRGAKRLAWRMKTWLLGSLAVTETAFVLVTLGGSPTPVQTICEAPLLRTISPPGGTSSNAKSPCAGLAYAEHPRRVVACRCRGRRGGQRQQDGRNRERHAQQPSHRHAQSSPSLSRSTSIWSELLCPAKSVTASTTVQTHPS